MRFASWLNPLKKQFCNAPRRRRATTAPPAAEHLEDRTLLTVTALFLNGELYVSSDANDAIAVGESSAFPGYVEVQGNGSPVAGMPWVLTSDVTAIDVQAGDQGNAIDLTGVTAAAFTNSAGVSINVTGGNGHDSILGSDDFGNNVNAGDGNDTITGGGANDTLDGGDGNDDISAGVGDDVVLGDDGADLLNGGSGNDSIIAGDGLDTASGGTGDDTIAGGNGADSLDGNSGDDSLDGDAGADNIDGGTGNDTVFGGSGNDTLLGDANDDLLYGQAGDDSLEGGSGDDQLNGGDDNDELLGNTGNDHLNGGRDNDSLDGGESDDTLFGGSGQDSLVGGGGNDSLFGQGGADTLSDAVGNDSLDGGTGNDLIEVGSSVAPALPASLSVSSVTITEGDLGTRTATFIVSLSAASSDVISVSYATQDGTATAGSDYFSANGTLTFPAGSTSQTVSVSVNGDAIDEFDETFFLNLSNPINAVLLGRQGIGTITDDDGGGAALYALAPFASGTQLHQVDPTDGSFTTIGTTGINSFAGLTFSSATGELLALQDDATATGPLYTINPYSGVATASTNASPATPLLEGDIAIDPSNSNTIYFISSGTPPTLHSFDVTTGAITNIANLQVNSVDIVGTVDVDAMAFRNGTLYAIITNGATGNDAGLNDNLVTIDTTNGAITDVGDIGFDFATGTVPVAAMAYDAAGDVFFAMDTTGELVSIDPATGTGTSVATSTLTEISGLAFATIGPQPVTTLALSGNVNFDPEGSSGTANATVDVTLTNAGTSTVTVAYSTVDGTAEAGTDYTATSGTLSFPVGTTTQSISVPVIGDVLEETDETFFITLSNPVGASLQSSQATVTIVNDDSAAATSNTLQGGDGNDTLIAAEGSDLLNGGRGDDSIDGGAGNDSLFGGSGNDTLFGGDGDDLTVDQGGNDQVDGGTGDDTLRSGGTGDDVYTNTSGADEVEVVGTDTADAFAVSQQVLWSPSLSTIIGANLVVDYGSSSATIDDTITLVTINAGNGADQITVSDLDHVNHAILQLNGDVGDDLIDATGADVGRVRPRLDGGEGEDTLLGSNGDDTIDGGAGNDTLSGNPGNDTLIGGDDEDSMFGDAGNDSLFGGNGNDTISGGDGDDMLLGEANVDRLDGGFGNDTLQGGDGNDTVNGAQGDDSLEGNAGQDLIFGGSGNDNIDGGRADDQIKGQGGDDSILGDHGDDAIDGGSGDDLIIGGDGDDRIIAGDGNDRVNGSDGNDHVNAGAGDDIVAGSDGNDTILGGAGRDVGLGEQGDDYVNGQGGFDTIAGGEGNDTLIGSAAEIDEAFTLPDGIFE